MFKMQQLQQRFAENHPDTLTTEPFNPNEDVYGTALVLSNLGLIGSTADLVRRVR